MNRGFPWTVCIVTAGCVSIALFTYLQKQSTTITGSTAQPTDGGAPGRSEVVLSCSQPFVDLGIKYRPVDTIKHQFQIRNFSSQAQTVRVANRSCTCTTARLTRDVIEAHGSADVEVVWKAPDQLGEQWFSVTLTVGQNMEILRLQGRAIVADILSIDPPAIDFGSIRPGERKTTPLILTTRSPEIPVDSIRVDPEHTIAPELQLTNFVQRPDRVLWHVSIVGTKDPCFRRYSIPLQFGTKRVTTAIVATAHHVGEISIAPEAVVLDRTEPRGRKSIEIERTDGMPLVLRECRADPPGLVDWKVQNVSRTKLCLHVWPKPGRPGKAATQVKVSVAAVGIERPVEVRAILIR